MALQWSSATPDQNPTQLPVSVQIFKTTAEGVTTGLQGSFTFNSNLENPTDQDLLDILQVMYDAYSNAGYTTTLSFSQVVTYYRSVEEV